MPPEKTESSPLEVPIIMWNSLMGDSVSTNPVQVHMIGTDCCQNRMITMRKTIYPRANLLIKKSLCVSTWIYDGQVTFPVFGGVLSMTIVPVAF